MTRPDNHGPEGWLSVLQRFAVGVIIVYVVGFLAILLDELVFRTFFIHSHLSESVVGALQIAYWPLIMVIRWMP